MQKRGVGHKALEAQGFKHAPSGQQLLGQKASDGSHEVLWAVSVDPVASVRHGLHLGSREESSNLRVVAGTVRQREGHQEWVEVGRWGEKEKGRQRAKRDSHELSGAPCLHATPS